MDNTQVATKDDVSLLRTELKTEIKAVKIDIKDIKLDIKNLKEEIRELRADNQKLDSKLDKLQNTLDKFVGIVDDVRTENTVGTYHTKELQTKVADHEDRLQQLESLKQTV